MVFHIRPMDSAPCQEPRYQYFLKFSGRLKYIGKIEIHWLKCEPFKKQTVTACIIAIGHP